MTRKILFTCKGNICRSPAAQFMLQQKRTDLIVDSAAFTPNTAGQFVNAGMAKTLYNNGYKYYVNPFRRVKHISTFNLNDWEVHNLHEAGISDPYLTGDFKTTMNEIAEYINLMEL